MYNNMFKQIDEYEKEYIGDVSSEKNEGRKLFVPSNDNAASDIAFICAVNLFTKRF